MIFPKFTNRFLSTLIILPLSFFFILYSQKVFLFFLFIVLIISVYEWYKLSKNSNFLFIFFIGSFFLFFSLYSAYYLRGQTFESSILFLWVLLVCIFTDIGGYLVGNLFGGKKLTKFSPNKTISGSVGSFIFSLISLLILMSEPQINFNIKIILITLFLSLISQVGDVTISFFKRKNKVKDTGKLLPGHGGLLDRIDGMIFVMPIAALFKYLQLY